MNNANKFMKTIGQSHYGVNSKTSHIPQMISNIGSTYSKLHTNSSSIAGFDAGSRSSGSTYLPSGTPRRYGKYFGIKPPGSSNY